MNGHGNCFHILSFYFFNCIRKPICEVREMCGHCYYQTWVPIDILHVSIMILFRCKNDYFLHFFLQFILLERDFNSIRNGQTSHNKKNIILYWVRGEEFLKFFNFVKSLKPSVTKKLKAYLISDVFFAANFLVDPNKSIKPIWVRRSAFFA